MATASTSVGFRMPAAYPYNQSFPASQGGVYTDTETQPSPVSNRSVEAIRPTLNRQTLLMKRNIAVQTKVFRTDQDSGAVDFSSVYTTVSEDLL